MAPNLLERMRSTATAAKLGLTEIAPEPAPSPPVAPDGLPIACPCQVCGNPFFWIDPYNAVHCKHCEACPRPAMNKGEVLAVGVPGAYAWELPAAPADADDATRQLSPHHLSFTSPGVHNSPLGAQRGAITALGSRL